MANNRSGLLLILLLNNQRQREESSLPHGTFDGYIAQGFRIMLGLCCILGLSLGAFLLFSLHEFPAGTAFFAIGLLALLLLPTFFSYRCHIDQNGLAEACFILCFPKKKSILWKDIAYKKVKRDNLGDSLSIRFYNRQGKKLISFDYTVVGLDRIVKLAKKIPKLP